MIEFLYMQIYLSTYLSVLFGPVKPELGVIQSGPKKKKKKKKNSTVDI